MVVFLAGTPTVCRRRNASLRWRVSAQACHTKCRWKNGDGMMVVITAMETAATAGLQQKPVDDESIAVGSDDIGTVAIQLRLSANGRKRIKCTEHLATKPRHDTRQGNGYFLRPQAARVASNICFFRGFVHICQ